MEARNFQDVRYFEVAVNFSTGCDTRIHVSKYWLRAFPTICVLEYYYKSNIDEPIAVQNLDSV